MRAATTTGERSTDTVPSWGATPLPVAAALVLLEVVVWHFGWWRDVAGVPLSPMAVVGLVFIGASLRGGRYGASALPIAAVTAAGCVLVSVHFSPTTALALIASAANEESVYRIALPALVVVVLRRSGARAPIPILAATAVGAFAFAALPGHVAQFAGSTFGAAPWVALTLLWVWMLWRGLAPAVVVAHHAGLNAVAFAVRDGAPLWAWQVAVVVPVVAFLVLEALRDQQVAATAPAPA